MAEEFPPLLVRCLVAHVEHPPSRNEIVHRCFHVVAGLTVNLLHTIHAGEAEFARADLHDWWRPWMVLVRFPARSIIRSQFPVSLAMKGPGTRRSGEKRRL